MPIKNNYITPQGYKVLEDELYQLYRVERPEVTKLVTWAASNGDRSENADYLYGKNRLREIDRRVRFLMQRMEAAVIVNPISIKSEKVQFGATVVIADQEGKEKTYSIVGVDENQPSKGHISWQSPIGKSLLGKEVGDEILVKIPQGEYTFEIISITYKSLN